MPGFSPREKVRGGTGAGLLAVNVVAIAFGSTALFGKLDVSPIWITAGRAAFAAITLFLLATIYRLPFRGRARDLGKAAGTGIILALHWLTFFASVQLSGVATATLTFATFPLFILVIDSKTRRQLPSLIELGAGLVIVIAVAILVGQGLTINPAAQNGALAGLLSALLFAIFSIASQRLGRKLSAVILSMYQNTAVVLFLAPGLAFALRSPQAVDWAMIAALGVVATALMHQLYFFSLKRLPAAVCGGFVALEPVYAIIFASVFFSEPISPRVIFSGALIVGASLLLLSRPGFPGPAG